MYQSSIVSYLTSHHYRSMALKAVLFDMDGVLFNSMPYHAVAWAKAMSLNGLPFEEREAYLHEGRTGAGTINIVKQRIYGTDATPEEIKKIYQDKCDVFNSFPLAKPFDGGLELVQKVKAAGLTPIIVTGSGQKSLLGRLEENYPGLFHRELMVTAFDVKIGKPNPEPYLMGLKKGHLQPNEAIVVENAPLGIESSVGANIFTVALNTGLIDDEVLLHAGANVLYPSMRDFCDHWEVLLEELRKTTL
jgi:beta-phosphoglucomutase-like phosphatase (HAD superfamily)